MVQLKAAVAVVALAACGTGAQSGSQTFQAGIIGSAPAGRMHPVSMMDAAGVRTLLVRLASGAVPVDEAQSLVAPHGYAVADIVAGGLARREEHRLRLAVNYLSADDQRLIAQHARVYGAELANLIFARRSDLEAAVGAHAPTNERRMAMLYFLVGCVALDWDGLAFTAERGYRTAATVSGPGFAYTPWMKENAPDISRRGLYWGSHNRTVGSHTFTTFGDHDFLPRLAVPDIFFSAAATSRVRALPSGANAATMLAEISAVLRAIHRGAHTPPQIAAWSGVAPSQLPVILALLQELAYIERTRDDVRLTMTVIEADVAPAAARIVTIVREVIETWHTRRFPNLQTDLATLTALRQGVPFEVLYNEIWHYIFGYANFFMAERGLIADPYRADAPFRGFLPFLWSAAIH